MLGGIEVGESGDSSSKDHRTLAGRDGGRECRDLPVGMGAMRKEGG